MKVSVAAIVMPLSRRGLVNEQKLLPPYPSPLFFKIVYVELHESIKNHNLMMTVYAYSRIAKI